MKTTPLDHVLPAALLALTAVTGLVDAASYLGLGHIFTANMTGNVVLLGFAVAETPGLSVARSTAALATFVAGAVLGGRMTSRPNGKREAFLGEPRLCDRGGASCSWPLPSEPGPAIPSPIRGASTP